MKNSISGSLGCFGGAFVGMIGLSILTLLGHLILRSTVANDGQYIVLYIGFVDPVGAVLGGIMGCAGVFLTTDERKSSRILLIGGWLCAVPLGLCVVPLALFGLYAVLASLLPGIGLPKTGESIGDIYGGFSALAPLFGLPFIWAIILLRNGYQLRKKAATL